MVVAVAMLCPSCNAPVADGQAECPSCGVIVSKWRGRAARAPAPAPVPTPRRTLPRILVVLVLGLAGAALLVGGYWYLEIRPRMLALEDPYYGSEPGEPEELRESVRASADFDLAFELPGRPQGAASDGRELIVASGSDPWGALRITQRGDQYSWQNVPIIETRYGQKTSLNTLTWNGRNYVGYTTGAWFGEKGDVFTIHDRKTLRVLETRPAPPLLGGLAWDGTHYWASTRKNTQDAKEEAFFYRLDPELRVVATSEPPGIGCQGLAWDGQRLWYVDVFSDSIKVLDVSAGEPRVIHSVPTPLNYLSGVVFHRNAVWVMDYGENRLHRLRNSTRRAWASYTEPEVVAAASMVPRADEEAKLTATYKNSFFDERGPEDAQEIQWSVELREDGLWLTGSRLWFGAELFVPREQGSSVVTIPIFARYTYTVELPDGSEVEKAFDATAGENVLPEVRLSDAEEEGRYSVSLFIHVQYVDANGTARILNNSGGFVEVRGGAAAAR